MDIAYAMGGGAGEGAAGLAGFIPLLLMGTILGLILMFIAKRKGKSQVLWLIAGYIPGWNLFGGLWLASLPDKLIIDEIEALKNSLQKISLASEGIPEIPSAKSQTWECNCGKVNDINVLNCPECGLKKDYLLKQTDET